MIDTNVDNTVFLIDFLFKFKGIAKQPKGREQQNLKLATFL